MIPQDNKLIKRKLLPEFEADQKEYRNILDDMLQNGGSLIPDPNWLIADESSKAADTYDKKEAMETALSEEQFKKKFSKMKALMTAWIGGTKTAAEFSISKYFHFLENCDLLGLWQANVVENRSTVPLYKADIGTIMDLNLLYAFSALSQRKVTRILEVGGGYGRLAEAAFNIFGRSIKYVLVDAVPVSLYFSKKYLTYTCPDAQIGSFYDGENNGFDFDDFDIAIVPSWHFERLNRLNYDICVNINSMQEMNQKHVDYYLNLFESVAVDGATIYISNSHDYYFLGTWNYPKNWQKLLCTNTPRSGRSDHPSEIFKKTRRDYSLQNAVVNSAYKYGHWIENYPDDFIARNGLKIIIIPLLKKIVKTVWSKLKFRTRWLRHPTQHKSK